MPLQKNEFVKFYPSQEMPTPPPHRRWALRWRQIAGLETKLCYHYPAVYCSMLLFQLYVGACWSEIIYVCVLYTTVHKWVLHRPPILKTTTPILLFYSLDVAPWSKVVEKTVHVVFQYLSRAWICKLLKVPKCEILMSWILMIFLSWSLYR